MMNYYKLEKTETYSEITIILPRFDTNAAPSVKAEITKLFSEENTNILFSLNNAKYCDSSALSALLLGHRLSSGNNKKFIIYGLNDTILNLIRISKLDTVLRIAENKEAALELLK
jgi:anti-anti-sigma factor